MLHVYRISFLLATLHFASGCGAPDTSSTTGKPLGRGAEMPPITAQGWINGEATPEQLQGKVVVIDTWFTTCHFCREEAPHLVEAHRKYAPRGVQFVGLTFEEADVIDDIRAFVRELDISWPNAYGAQGTLDALQVEGYPTLFVVGADGKIAWNSDDGGPQRLEVALEQALSRAPKTE